MPVADSSMMLDLLRYYLPIQYVYDLQMTIESVKQSLNKRSLPFKQNQDSLFLGFYSFEDDIFIV